jgi:hypothetical protein
METSIMDSSWQINSTGQESSNGLMDEHTRESGKQERSMAKESTEKVRESQSFLANGNTVYYRRLSHGRSMTKRRSVLKNKSSLYNISLEQMHSQWKEKKTIKSI